MKVVRFLLVVGFLGMNIYCSTAGYAAPAKTTPSAENTLDDSVSNRMKNRAGGYVGILGDPFPTIIGLNVAYNVFDFMRATAGLGQISASIGTAEATATTIGMGARFFVPKWSFSPVAGLSMAYVSVSQTDGLSISVKNFDQSGAHLYANLGIDWQAATGFNVGAGYNLSFKSGIGGLPYLNLGWYFNFI
jgi:hypothetical protein